MANTTINISSKKAVWENRIPVEVDTEVPNAETIKAIKDTRNGIGLSKAFSSVSELMEDLDK